MIAIVSQWAYVTALVITLACEAPVVAVGYAKLVTPVRLAAGFVAVNLFTHGLLWTIRPPHATSMMIAEGVIVLVEAGLYRLLFGGTVRRAALVSLLANGFSLAVGVWVAR